MNLVEVKAILDLEWLTVLITDVPTEAEEVYTWTPEDDQSRRTLTLMSHEDGLWVIVKDRNERPKQAWVVLKGRHS